MLTSRGFCALGKRWSSWAIDCFNRESFGSKAAVCRALITHVGLVGCFPSPMGDPQSGGKVWVDPEERLVGLGSCDFLTRGRIWAGEHESLCRERLVGELSLIGSLLWAFMMQDCSIRLGDLTHRPVWVLTGVTRSFGSFDFLTSSV